MSDRYQTVVVMVDGASVATTPDGAAVIEALKEKVRGAQAVIDGLQGQVDAFRSMAPPAPNSFADARTAAAASKTRAHADLANAWRADHRPLASA